MALRATVPASVAARPAEDRQWISQSRPIPTQIAPGTRNAARHPARSASAPATKAEAATPMLPQTPFTPSRRPILPPARAAPWLTMAMPTGW